MTGDPAQETVARLREAGLRVTRPRLAVTDALRSMGGHRTADEVHAHLGEHGVTLPRTSVYNSLVVLADLGVVLRADVGPGAAVYEFADTWHHHFVCTRCGRVSDVSCLVGAKPCLTAGDDVGRVDEAQVIFRGTCRHCLHEHASNAPGEPPSAPSVPPRGDRSGDPHDEHRDPSNGYPRH
ncbi:Fur family transcriptional regulator [Streptantibioticus ferralitis]|uniref:Fur family transcriptional regulator n=1 Tax=Streptantibioticus ferralitis TaxID=236510 RepID=A0ABT5YUA7_9ACTN|nr:Fur family transcriptional regulator [Streptantibioticus ferralitis]MDF2255184.1 Fur family transcriptional regulator [Streptantibioticus ferralitis]